MLLDEMVLQSELLDEVKYIKKDFVKLDNGAEGYFIRLSDERLAQSPAKGENGKFPMLTTIHGGPFAAGP